MQASRIDTILASLTLPEKIKLLGGQPFDDPSKQGGLYGIERVGLPALKFADGPVGAHWWTRADASTCYPALICLAASFDEGTAQMFGEAIGTDCRAYGVHVLLAPGVNLYRSPLSGRNFEYFGEDPEISGRLGAAYIRGVQAQGVAATVKHYLANNSEFNRYATSADIDERTLHEVYLRPFEIAVREADVGCVMTSFNRVNQQYPSESPHLLDAILRRQWGFRGCVMCDWGAVYSTAQALEAGNDFEMPAANYATEAAIMPLVETGVVTEDLIDTRVRKRLELMERFGWLDENHQQCRPDLPDPNPATEAVALEVARRGIVLLKNDCVVRSQESGVRSQHGATAPSVADGKSSLDSPDFPDFPESPDHPVAAPAFTRGDTTPALPAPPEKIRTIALIGRHATERIYCGGGSAYNPPHPASTYTLEEALRATYGSDVQITTHTGYKVWNEEEATEHTKFRTPDGQHDGVLAEYFNSSDWSGEPAVARIEPRPKFFYLGCPPDPAITAADYTMRYTGQFTTEKDEDYDVYIAPTGHKCTVWIDGQPVGAAKN